MKVDHALDPWSIRIGDVGDNPADVIRHAVAVATLAPSSHNTQPWKFVLRDRRVEVWADRSRRLPVVDPDDRELVMSCGAALDHLALVLEHLGFPSAVELLPDGDSGDLLATVVVPAAGAERGGLPDEMSAILRRRTNRNPFDVRPIDGELVERMRHAAEALGAWMRPMPPGPDRVALAGLVAEGDRIQMSDRTFRSELATWVRRNHSPARDGMRARAFGVSDLASYLGPFVVRTFDRGRRQAAEDRRLAVAAPLVIVIGTDGDSPAEWIAAGRALSRLLLAATGAGVSAAFMNQPVELPELRQRLAELLGTTGSPQLVLRLGHGPDIAPQPRRRPDEVFAVP